MTIAVRPAELEDADLVVSNWSRAFKFSRSAGILADEDYARVMHPTIQRILNRPGVVTLIGYEKADPLFTYGWICGNPTGDVPVIHFLYVKEPYRRLGYARKLCMAIGIDPMSRFIYSCWTPMLLKVPRLPRAIHDPNAARFANYVFEEQEQWKR